MVLAVYPTAGQRQECTVFPTVLRRARRPRRRSRPRWPRRLAGDKGYSYPGIRAWLRRRHIGAVIPTRSNQPPDDDFDPTAYRRRNIIERVVGWFKECRTLGTRYEKLAVNYIALWVMANIHYLLRKRLKALKRGLSETA